VVEREHQETMDADGWLYVHQHRGARHARSPEPPRDRSRHGRHRGAVALVKIPSTYTSHPMDEGTVPEHAVRMVAFPPQTTAGITSPSDVALYELFQDLETTAEKISNRAVEPMAPDELALAAASLERASAALAAGVEQAAYAIASAPRDRRAIGSPPPHARRAISWRLHGLANALRRCRELSTVVRDAVERARTTAPDE
jgi:hypothetical protein